MTSRMVSNETLITLFIATGSRTRLKNAKVKKCNYKIVYLTTIRVLWSREERNPDVTLTGSTYLWFHSWPCQPGIRKVDSTVVQYWDSSTGS